MGEGQWFQPTVVNKLSKTIILTKFNVEYGKFYDINNRFVQTAEAGGTKIKPGSQFEFGLSGLQASPSGTNGTFEVHLDDSGDKIAVITWSVPFGSSENTLRTSEVPSNYNVTIGNTFSYDSGPLGKGTITFEEA